MGTERQSRISQLYHAALARAPEERAAFLRDECGDEHLRREVESLLGYKSVPGFLDAPVAALQGVAMAGGTELPREFASYRLIAPLGSGGMGDVYRARDTKLGRDVAVKVLPPHFTTDPERRARFVREARLLATLNHPYIAAIHGYEEVDGITALILELVEGQTLGDRLAGGPVPIADALVIARQLAEALEAAHEKGIIHRDLKPANIVVRGGVGVTSSDPSVKVLDFGLAKPTREALDGELADNPTVSAAGTIEGRILGTPAYMSPEQARGLAVDKRTDIWSFGCVLYEMLTGRRPFHGETTTDVMAAVVGQDPDWTALPRATPQRIRLLLARCLQKDPKMRLRDIGDARIELTPTDTDAVGVSDASAAEDRPAKSRLVTVAAAAGLVLALVAGAWWYRHSLSSPQQAPGGSTPTPVPVARPLRRLTFDPGQLQTNPTFSPDGRSIAYASDHAGNFDIWIQALDGGQPRQVTHSPAPETQPAWSHDGKRLVFRVEGEKGGLFRIPAEGGPATQLTSFGIDPTWSADDSEVVFRVGLGERQTGIFTVPSGGGEAPRALARPFLEGGIWFCVGLHPDGRISAYGRHKEQGFGFFTVSRDGSSATVSKMPRDFPLPAPRPDSRARFQWNYAGTALYVEAVLQEVRNIWRVRVNPATLEWLDAERLTTGSGADVGPALSRDGTRMIFAVEQGSVRLWKYPLDAVAGRLTGSGFSITPEDARIEGGVLSPDGEWVAYRMLRTGTDRIEAFMTNLTTDKTESVGINAAPMAWSPDSRTLAYTLWKAGPAPREAALAVRDVDGPERIIRPWTRESYMFPTSWTLDGRSIVGSFLIRPPLAKVAAWPNGAAPLGSERILLEHPDRGLWQAGVSPNGRWFAFVAGFLEGTAQVKLYIAREGTPASDWIPVANDHPWADKPRWSPDGKLLYFVSNEGSPFFNLWAVPFDPERGALAGTPFQVTKFDSPALAMSTNMVLSQIGISPRRAMLTMVSTRGNIWMLENVDQ